MGGFVEDVVGGVGDLVGGAVDATSEAWSGLDDLVNDNLPGGWALPLAAAATVATGGAAAPAFLGEAGAAGAAEAGFGDALFGGAMGPWDAGTLGAGFEDYMAASGFDPTVLSGLDLGGIGGSPTSWGSGFSLPGGLSNLFKIGGGGNQQSQTFPWMQAGFGLADMYNRNQAAKTLQDRYNQINTQINGMYAPGSPEYNALWNEMSRKDAAAGRNSQYGVRATDLGAKIAGLKGTLLSNLASPQNNLLSAGLATNASQLGSLANIFGQQGGTTSPWTNSLNTAINQGVSNAIDYGMNSIKDLFNW
jgi:hypothetical protein